MYVGSTSASGDRHLMQVGSGSHRPEDAQTRVNQMSATDSIIAVQTAAELHSDDASFNVAVVRAATDFAFNNAQVAAGTALSGRYDVGTRQAGRKLLQRGNGNHPDSAADTVSQLAITQSVGNVQAAADANTIAATLSATNAALTNAKIATASATIGRIIP